MISARNKHQLSLFAPGDAEPSARSWTVISYDFDSRETVAAALGKALDNVSARRDPALRECSFDLYSRFDARRYSLALPGDLHPAVAGMIERKLLEVSGFDELQRGVTELGREYKPAGYYEAGAAWVATAHPAGGARFPREPREDQLTFDY